MTDVSQRHLSSGPFRARGRRNGFSDECRREYIDNSQVAGSSPAPSIFRRVAQWQSNERDSPHNLVIGSFVGGSSVPDECRRDSIIFSDRVSQNTCRPVFPRLEAQRFSDECRREYIPVLEAGPLTTDSRHVLVIGFLNELPASECLSEESQSRAGLTNARREYIGIFKRRFDSGPALARGGWLSGRAEDNPGNRGSRHLLSSGFPRVTCGALW
jgi:hypothetical protein